MENKGENKPDRDELGRVLPGNLLNPNGRPKMTEDEKLIAKAKRDFVKEYTEGLMASLPMLSPILIAKAMEGDMAAIKEVNDRAMGKPKQAVEVEGNVGLSISFSKEFDDE
jgi:hypothetical protein